MHTHAHTWTPMSNIEGWAYTSLYIHAHTHKHSYQTSHYEFITAYIYIYIYIYINAYEYIYIYIYIYVLTLISKLTGWAYIIGVWDGAWSRSRHGHQPVTVPIHTYGWISRQSHWNRPEWRHARTGLCVCVCVYIYIYIYIYIYTHDLCID